MEEDARKGWEEICKSHGRTSGDRSHIVKQSWAESGRELG